MSKDIKPENRIEPIKNPKKRDHLFKKGNKANPKGRPVGSGIQGQLRKQLNANMPNLLTKLITMANEGDLGALRILMDKGLGSRKPESFIDIEVPPELDIGEKIDYLVHASTMGAVSGEAVEQIAKSALIAKNLKADLSGAEVIEVHLGNTSQENTLVKVRPALPPSDEDQG